MNSLSAISWFEYPSHMSGSIEFYGVAVAMQVESGFRRTRMLEAVVDKLADDAAIQIRNFVSLQ